MSLLEQEISYDHLTDWGALKIYDERLVRRWFGDKTSITVAEALQAKTKPGIVFWTIMREELLPAPLMHQMAVDMCRRFLDQLQARGVYIDFRSRKALDAKQAWLNGEISLGELKAAERKAIQARADVSELQDPLVSAGAHAACQASIEDAAFAFRSVFYAIEEAAQHGAVTGMLRAANAQAAIGAECIETVRQTLQDYQP